MKSSIKVSMNKNDKILITGGTGLVGHALLKILRNNGFTNLWPLSSTDCNLIEKNQEQLGIYKKPVAAGRASGNLKYSIVPGHSNESIMLYRMQSLDPGIMMPESGRALADEAGINLIKEWIDKL